MPRDLSGGQKQRVAIIRSLMIEPEVLMFDEPTSALDSEKKRDLVDIINDLKKEITIVAITHDINFASKIANKVIFIDKGQVLANQPCNDFFKEPSSQRAKLFLDY
jgi:polar amino acid transport system ATP-binding protein